MSVNFCWNLWEPPIIFLQLPPSLLSHFNTCLPVSQYLLRQNKLETLKWTQNWNIYILSWTNFDMTSQIPGGLISATLIGLSYLFWAQNATTNIGPHWTCIRELWCSLTKILSTDIETGLKNLKTFLVKQNIRAF